MRTPTMEQISALQAFAASHGRTWKSALSAAWMSGNYGSVSDEDRAMLQSLRNSFGPSWLARFRLPEVQKAGTGT